MFDFDFSDELRAKLEKFAKKDRKRAEILRKKISEIISSSNDSIEHYKNLKYGLKNCKRVHIDSSFVLIFEVDVERNRIIFLDFDHHDKIYRHA